MPIKIEKILGSNVDDSGKLEEYLKAREKKGKGYGVVMRGRSGSCIIETTQRKEKAMEIYKELRKKNFLNLITLYKYEINMK